MKTASPLVLAFGVAFAPASFAEEPMKPSGAAQALLSDDAGNFFETAASTNMFELQASKLAAERATDPKIKEFAAMMVEDHTKAAEELRALAKQKNVTLPQQMLDRHQLLYDDLLDEEPGEAFDEEYVDKMELTHKEAVSLFDEVARETDDAQVRQLAQKLLPTLQKHGGKAESLPEA